MAEGSWPLHWRLDSSLEEMLSRGGCKGIREMLCHCRSVHTFYACVMIVHACDFWIHVFVQLGVHACMCACVCVCVCVCACRVMCINMH